jgi:hypothetical protein
MLSWYNPINCYKEGDNMQPDEMDDQEMIEYKAVLKKFARMAADHPEMIDNIRASLKFCASAMITNRPETKVEFGKAVEEMDSFLNACQTGEVDPHAFIRSMDEEESNS